MAKKQQFSIWYVLLAVMVLLSMQNYLGGYTETLAYSDFRRLLGADKLENLTFSEVDIRGTVRTDGSMTSVDKSKAKVHVETDTQVTFDDVAGVDEAKEEPQETLLITATQDWTTGAEHEQK